MTLKIPNMNSIKPSSLTHIHGKRSHTQRNIEILPHGATTKFCDNSVSTSKYTMTSFIPRSLFEQFRRAANVYFLIISIFQLSTDLSPTSKYATILPLTCVIMLTMLKEAFEDRKRHIADHQVNRSIATIVDRKTKALRKVLWEEVRVGDILQIRDRDAVCADGILLSTTDDDGTCFIETANLDGETDLKIRRAVSSTHKISKPKHCSKLRGTVQCETPNANIYRFQATLSLLPKSYAAMMRLDDTMTTMMNEDVKNPTDNSTQSEHDTKSSTSGASENCHKIDVSNANLLLRGSVIRNTSRVFILVVFTGFDTKQMQNTNSTPSKRSNVDILIDKVILLIFFTLLVLSSVTSIAFSIWTSSHASESASIWYLPYVASATLGEQLRSFITFMILFNNLVPISLYVSIELVKIVQAKLMESDLKMFDEISASCAITRSSALNEDLGQIQHIFTDKTGTLTNNVMKFKRMSVMGRVYDSMPEEIIRFSLGGLEQTKTKKRSFSGPQKVSIAADKNEYVRRGPKLMRHLKHKRDSWEHAQDLLRMMAVCNTVVPERVTDHNGGTMIRLQSASPDEEALVHGAQGYGFELLHRDDCSMIVKCMHEVHTFEVLQVLEFTCERRCMSVIVRTPEKTIEVYCKGADDLIFSRLSSDQQQYIKETRIHLHWFAVNGLRTLLFAKSEIDEEFFTDWKKRFDSAQALMEDREEEISMLCAEIESELTLIGATAIEDRLQAGVPTSIKTFLKANIKVWMLTGDKIETAINIALSCHLIDIKMNVIRLEFDNVEMMLLVLDTALKEINGNSSSDDDDDDDDDNEMEQSKNNIIPSKVEDDSCGTDKHTNRQEETLKTKYKFDTEAATAVVVDGRSLTLILEDDEASSLFFELCKSCSAVVACRVSPRQKASLVRLAKKHYSPMPMTLAIGDGANDVGMLQEAHVGVGIIGSEGMQAVRSSDYAIGQFRFLVRLLLVHGNWNYRRISTVILYSFYKNIANVLTLFYYCFYNGFSGTTLYESWLSAGWNVGWTFIPIILYGILDRDLNPNTLIAFPHIYERGQKCSLFNYTVMIRWVLNAFVHSIVVFFLGINSLRNDIAFSNGQTHDLWSLGTAINGCMVVVVNFKILLESAFWTPIFILSILSSVFLWFIFVQTYSSLQLRSLDYFAIGYNLHVNVRPWMVYIIVPISAIIIDVVITFVKRVYFSSPIDIASKIQKNDPEFSDQKARATGENSVSNSSQINTIKIPAESAPFQRQRSGKIESTFAFSHPTMESGVRQHDEVNYPKETSEEYSSAHESRHRRTKEKKRKSRKLSDSVHRVVIHGPTVEALAYLKKQLLEEEQEQEEFLRANSGAAKKKARKTKKGEKRDKQHHSKAVKNARDEC